MYDGGVAFEEGWFEDVSTEPVVSPRLATTHARVQRRRPALVLVAGLDVSDSSSAEPESLPEEGGVSDLTVFPGESVTPELLKDQQIRDRLSELIERFQLTGFPSQSGAFDRISQETRDAALGLIASLPRLARLPRIVPDGDGDLAMCWEIEGALLLAIIEGWKVHIVREADTVQAEFIQDVPLRAGRIPAQLVQFLLPT